MKGALIIFYRERFIFVFFFISLHLNDVNGGGRESDRKSEAQLQIFVDGSESQIVEDRNEDVSRDWNGKNIVKAEEEVDQTLIVDHAWNGKYPFWDLRKGTNTFINQIKMMFWLKS